MIRTVPIVVKEPNVGYLLTNKGETLDQEKAKDHMVKGKFFF